jgi:hypothetical protein
MSREYKARLWAKDNEWVELCSDTNTDGKHFTVVLAKFNRKHIADIAQCLAQFDRQLTGGGSGMKAGDGFVLTEEPLNV